ncbi:hypothetical protein CRG98_017715 [Punica granatum]|uniref:Uncharacterized protein n=1 Tax=Punica granatum TaxID=22663 RepID=A0A2I0K2G7_PUNGR|nr:hypothetical protein CRG98_017715 [Punica granatum]
MEEDGKAWMRRPWVWPWAPRVMREVRVLIDRVFEGSLEQLKEVLLSDLPNIDYLLLVERIGGK